MSRPTVHDIAKEAGVSLATVDRVLNARPGVRDKTIARVRDAVDRIGYVRDTSAANLAKQRQYRFAFVLPESRSQFVRALETALEEAYSYHLADRTHLRILHVPSQDHHAIARTLKSLGSGEADGIAVMAPETPQVRDALSRLKDSGLAVVTLVSDLPNSRRDFFVGVNSVSAGRTAGLLMGRFARSAGDVLVVTDTMRSRDSLERRLGFDPVMANEYAELTVLPSLESHDDPERMARIVAEAAASRENLAGVYSMGPSNATLLNALRKSGRLRDLVVIAHELTPATRQALLNDEIAAVIAQNVGHLARSSMRVMRNVCDSLPIFESQERIRIEVVLRENLP